MLAVALFVVAAAATGVGVASASVTFTPNEVADVRGFGYDVDPFVYDAAGHDVLGVVGASEPSSNLSFGSLKWAAGRDVSLRLPRNLVAPRSAPPSTFNRTESLSGRPSSRQVTEMAEEMRTSGWNGDSIKVVDVGGDLYVVDGHHRLAAARQAGIDVPYEIVDPTTVIGPGQWSSIDDILRDAAGVGPDRFAGRPR